MGRVTLRGLDPERAAHCLRRQMVTSAAARVMADVSGEGGGGGGGRIAISYAITNVFKGGISARGGAGLNYGGAGTIYLGSSRQLGSPQVIVDNGGQRGTNTLLGTAGLINLTVSGGGSLV